MGEKIYKRMRQAVGYKPKPIVERLYTQIGVKKIRWTGKERTQYVWIKSGTKKVCTGLRYAYRELKKNNKRQHGK